MKELERFAPLGLLALVVAGCTIVKAAPQPAASAATALTVAQLRYAPPSATLVLVVNPSARAEDLSLQHAATVIADVSAPNLTVIGLYEQQTSDDGAPFDRPFLSTASPAASNAPAVAMGAACRGTNFQKHTCKDRNEVQYRHDVAQLRAWRRQLDQSTTNWTNGVLAQIDALRKNPMTEGDRIWDLRAVLLRAGQALQADGHPNRCIVLLGGLAVRTPPPVLPNRVLVGTKLVVADWQGTQAVQDAWRKALSPASVEPMFLPGAVTDLHLVGAVRSCLGREA